MDLQDAKPNGIPALDRSWAFRRTAAVAVAAIAVGIGLVVWSGQSTRVVRVVVAVRPNGRGNLFVTNLAPAPRGKTYEAWVISNGRVRPAGLFDGARGTVLVHLPGRLSSTSSVVATLERAGGVKTLTQLSGAHKAVFDVHV
jgi:hypothetical protein